MQSRKTDTSEYPNFQQRVLNKIKLKLLWMEKRQDILTYLIFQTFLNEFHIKSNLKLFKNLHFGNSPDYNQYTPVRRQKMQGRLSDISEFPNFPQRKLNKIELKFLWMEKGARFFYTFDLLNFLQRNLILNQIEIVRKIAFLRNH